jgi:hypothetical protein
MIFLAMVPLMNRLLWVKIARRASFGFLAGSRNARQAALHNFKRRARPFDNRRSAGGALPAMRAIWFSFAAGLAILGGFSASAEEHGAGAPPSGYAEKLVAYEAARAAFESEAGPYWQSVADKRRLRNEKRRKKEVVALEDYMLTQPPIYLGPPQPTDPDKPAGEQPTADKLPIPVVADFVRSAQEQFGFVPDRPGSENQFKKAYAERAKKAGLTRDQIVRIYGFESGGDGKYDVQAGLEYSRPDARAVSTALGYNQLLGANSVELLAEKGDTFLSALQAKADASASGGNGLSHKLDVLGRMIGTARSVPDEWSAHEGLAVQPQGLGIHALNLDVDVGPLLQVQKLLDSVIFAKSRGFAAPLTAAELEMMNLTGDGNGLDMVAMPPQMRERVPTSNFFQRGGYERNPVARRNDTVAKLIAATDVKMDAEAQLNGARALSEAYDSARP